MQQLETHLPTPGLVSSQKTYRGRRLPSGSRVVVLTPDQELPLRHYVKHSPTGFEWGYAGSGPAELARCILIDALGERAKCPACEATGRCLHREDVVDAGGVYCADCGFRKDEGPVEHVRCFECYGERFGSVVEKNYQRFKFEVIAALNRDEWELAQVDVLRWLEGRSA